jgi:uncharacterized membrane protein
MIRRSRRYLLTGLVTVIPIIVTIFVFSVFLDLLSDIGRPKAVVVANAVKPFSPELARSLVETPWLQSALAVLLTIAMFYLLGWMVSRIVGRRLLAAIEYWVDRIPLVATVYGATKRVIDAFHHDRGQARQVVLVEFPHSRMKAVGLVTRTLVDEGDGTELAAVYVPTAPNPTGGYLEIVPVDDLITLDWSVDEAMAFVISGGTTGPASIRYRASGRPVADRSSGAPAPVARGTSPTGP